MAGSLISPDRIRLHKLTRFNPIRNLSPQILTTQIEGYYGGMIRDFAMTMEAIENRDDTIKAVAPKRKKSVSRRSWEIITIDGKDDAEAERHAEALTYFYNNIEATNALDRNERRGFSGLVERMMDAVGKRYAVHEIVWRPTTEGLTATMNFVPLWFFENRSGRLRFLENDFMLDGVPLENKGDFIVTVGDGIMEACAVAYMYKVLPLRDWLIYTERHGMPGLVGKTDAARDSDQWDDMEDAISKIGTEFAAVMSTKDEIERISFTAEGQLPYGPLIERMDRSMSSLWRGADLSTISAGSGSGQGASLQWEEAIILEQGDVAMINETLNMQLDTLIIRNVFGEGVMPLAYIKINAPDTRNIDQEIKVDDHLKAMGIPQGQASILERFGRKAAEDGEDIATGTPEPKQQDDEDMADLDDYLANEQGPRKKLMQKAAAEMAKSQAEVLAPLRERIAGILEMPDDASFQAASRQLQNDLPDIMKKVNMNPETSAVLEKILSASWFNGAADATVAQKGAVKPSKRRSNRYEQPININVTVPPDGRNGGKTVKVIRGRNGEIISAKFERGEQ